ncbi:MAG: hypothetical protein ACR2OC_06480, partial [Solirubrobacterales bacterium]
MTIGLGEYIAGAVELAIVAGAAAYAASGLRARLLPGWTAAPARLAEIILGLALIVVISELLGVFGLFTEAALLLTALIAGLATGTAARRAGGGGGVPLPLFAARRRRDEREGDTD